MHSTRWSGLVWCMVVLCTAAGTAGSPEPGPVVIPQPVRMTVRPGVFSITASTVIYVDRANTEVGEVAEYLAEQLRIVGGQKPTVRVGPRIETSGGILLTAEGADPALGPEGYELLVTTDSVLLRALTPDGLFKGVQTVRQLLPWQKERINARNGASPRALSLPCVQIWDRPRYAWRGMLLDCCRHFMSKAFVKRYIDLLAYHKMNVLHWHLTEDQGWRIEIKKYPKLTEVGAWRGQEDERYGGYYTQRDIREIVEYARSRYVTVVPEIEMPGHSMAALASYPWLGCKGEGYEVGTRWGVYSDVYCAGNDRVFEFLADVLLEVIGLFPSEYIHIGGDECPKTAWKACSKCQARIKSEGLRDEHELQSYFIRRIEKFLNGRDRRLIGWDEILEGGLAPNATVQSWRGMDGAVAAARAGHDVIASPTSHCYLDYSHEAISLERIYAFEPTPAELSPEQARHVLGAEGNMWTERAPQERVDRQVFPRLCGLAEVTWSPAERRDWDSFSKRMKIHYRRLDALGVNYHLPSPRCTASQRVFTDSTRVSFENPLGEGEIRLTLDGGEPTRTSALYVGPFSLAASTELKARLVAPRGRLSDVAVFRFTKQTPRAPDSVAGVRPGLRYACYEGIWDRLPDFDTLVPVAQGIVPDFDISVRQRDDHFALTFSGYVEVPADGIYTFFLTSDDGSRLSIGADLVVDHDGLHSASERSGQIILRAGRHPITVAMFEGSGSQVLDVQYSGPGIDRTPIPPGALTHRAD